MSECKRGMGVYGGWVGGGKGEPVIGCGNFRAKVCIKTFGIENNNIVWTCP